MTARMILASGSPRRRELLTAAGFSFEITPSDIDEVIESGASPLWATVRLAIDKAEAVIPAVEPGSVVLSADTTVVAGGRIYGKPVDADGAEEMLLELAGRNHVVCTGWSVAVAGADPTLAATGFSSSIVRLRDIGRSEAREYAQGGEPLDKAGSYAVQGEGSRFVAAVIGPIDNVIGLPVEPVSRALEALGVARAGV